MSIFGKRQNHIVVILWGAKMSETDIDAETLSALESKLAKRQLAKDLIEYYQHVRVLHQEEIKRIYDLKDFDDAYAIVDLSW